MITRKPILLVTGLIAIAAAVLSVIGWQAQRNDRNALVAAERNRVQLLARIARVDQQAAQANRNQRALRAKMALAEAKNRAATKPNALAAFDAGAAIMNDPKFQAAYFASQRPKLLLRYGALFQTLGLTPAQIDRFVRNAITRDETALDLAATARAQHLSPSDPSIAGLFQKMAADYQSAQSDLLGESGYSQTAEFERAAPVRGVVDGVAGQLALAGEPLTAQQADQLVQAAASTSPPDATGPNGAPASVDWDAALEKVRKQGILSPTQLAAYTSAVQSAEAFPKILGLLPQRPTE